MISRSATSSTLRFIGLALACALAAAQAFAFREPQQQSLQGKVLAPYGFVATVVPQELSEVEQELDSATRADLAAFRAEAGHNWKFYIDRRSGGMALVEGEGVPWITGQTDAHGPAPQGRFVADVRPTLAVLAETALEFVDRYPSLFRIPSSQLVLDERGSVNLGEAGQFWNVVFRQAIGGVPVEGARVVFRISHGNLVQFGVDRTIPLAAQTSSAAPALSPARARTAVAEYVGEITANDSLVEEGTLRWVAQATDDASIFVGPIGTGWRPVLLYGYLLERKDEMGSWLAYVDAHGGEVVRFVDTNDYAALVKGSVYTFTNCTDSLNCVPGSAAETTITMPYASLNFVGGSCSGDACFSNSAGAFDYPSGSAAASTSLTGKYFQINDTCGAIAAAAAAPNNLDLGTSDPSTLGTNTDCAPATRESAPNSGPTSGGTGDTHSSRNCFYHLNLINEKSRVYLPGNEWLKGSDGTGGPVLTNVNGPPACNAFWQPATGSLSFFKMTPGLGCNNTGEIPDVFLHEFGHGLDHNDATGAAPESGTGEAMGDTFALLQGQHSCIGPGFSLPIPTNVNWGNRAGYGTGSALCSGVRDIDYTRFCYHTTAPGCGPSLDPDAPNGARSGLTPPPNPPEAGTPARWNHMIAGSPNGVTNGQSNFYNCGGPETGGCAGPLDHGCHCESMIASQSNWDLAKRLIAFEFGGDIYRVPQGPQEVSGWQYADRLWYLTRDLAVSAYTATGPAPAGQTNGCAVDNWFTSYRFIDDNDGNLANGTPHAGIIFSAFDLHAIACGQASDPSNQPTGCPAPIAAPTLSVCAAKSPVPLAWTPSPGATEYRVLRNTLGCGFGFTPIATVDGGDQYYEDSAVAPGIPYYYTVQPVGANDSCYGQASNCVQVVPTTCAATVAPPPTGVATATPADNMVRVSWNAAAGAGSYKVFRKPDGCGSAAPFAPVGSTTAPGTTFDDTGLVAGATFSYRVASSDTSCAACISALSACQSATTLGECIQPPQFAGVASVSADSPGQCRLTVSWDEGSSPCGSLSYSVHRSTDRGFVPDASNLIASGVTGTSFTDFAVAGGIRYYYVVRAKDVNGNAEFNARRVGEMPVGGFTPGTFQDDAGDTAAAKFANDPTIGASAWTIRPSGTLNATKQYATSETGNYLDETCLRLESQTLFLAANPSLSFSSRYDIELGWDGGIIEVATEGGGFSDWTKLGTVNYPGLMAGPQGSPACPGPGFADGEPAFSGTVPAWQTYTGSLSAYANQNVRIRFTFGSDPSTNGEGWFVDDIMVTGARLPGSCVGEVSGKGSSHQLLVRRRVDGNLDLIFEDLGPAVNSYNVYEGDIGTWYSHEGGMCHDTTTSPNTPVTGERTLFNYLTGSTAAYYLVSASDAASEGILGQNSQNSLIPPASPPCGPTP